MKRLVLLGMVFCCSTVTASEQNVSKQQKSKQEEVNELYVRYLTIDNQLVDLEKRAKRFPYVTLEQYVFIMQWMNECHPVMYRQKPSVLSASEQQLLARKKLDESRKQTAVRPITSILQSEQPKQLKKPDWSEL